MPLVPAEIVRRYNHLPLLALTDKIDLTKTYCMLLDQAAVAAFDATHTTVDQVTGAPTGTPAHRPHEIYGYGWAEGGIAFPSLAYEQRLDKAALKGGPISIVPTGDIGAYGELHYCIEKGGAAKLPLQLVDYQGQRIAGEGTAFNVKPDATGVLGTLFIVG